MNNQPLPVSGHGLTKIMIVDDDQDILDSLRDVLELESEQYEIQTAANVESAKKLSSSYHPDIALLDIKIGQNIGLELVPDLKQATPYTKCIMMTAFRDSDYAVEAIRKGADDYLFKPLEPEHLLKLLNHYANAVKLEKLSLLAQNRFQAIFEQSFLNTYILSPGGEIMDINSTALKLSEHERAALVGRCLWKTPPFEFDPKFSTKVKHMILGMSADGHTEQGLNLETDTGDMLYLDFAAKPILTSEGHYDSIIVEINDNSEIYEANQTIRNLNSNLEETVKERTLKLQKSVELLEKENLQRKKAEADLLQASEAKSLFLSRVSHELRTPMNAILGFTQLLELEELTLAQEDYVSEIHGAGDHLMELINEILDLSRIESGKLEVRIEKVSLQDALASSISLITPLAQRRHIEIYVRDIDNRDYYLAADPRRLKQVLLNLLSNAIKYNVDHGRVEIRMQADTNGMLRISIQDTGIGIDQQLHHRLFNPFDMLGQEYAQNESSGIGLAITRKLVEIMEGEISFESEVGKGSTFHVLLPLLPPA